MAIATITNTQGHRIVYPASGFAQLWDTGHDATTGGTPTHLNSSGTSAITVGLRYTSYPSANRFYIYRAFIDFDLSSIPAGSTINSATLKLYGNSATSPHFSIVVATADIIVLKANFDTSIAADDYDSFLNDGSSASGWGPSDTTPYSSEYAGSGWDNSDYNEITLNSTALTDIASAAGSGRFVTCIMHHDGDYQDDDSIVDASNDWSQVAFNLIDDLSNPPQLVVDYTPIPHSFAGGGGNFPAIYAKINGMSKVTNDFKVNGFKDVHVNGIAEPNETAPAPAGGTAHTFLARQSQWANGAADGASGINGTGRVPTGWQSNTSDTVYGSTTADRAWTSDGGGTTPSSNTGPTAGHDNTYGDGREASITDDYIYTEATSQFNKRMLLRTPELDLSTALANNTLQLEFWFHMYGGNISTAGLGVAVTDNSTSAADTTLGLHFTGETTGGATIVFWDTADDDGSSTASGVRISGQQQTAGHGLTSTAAHWRKATVDLNSVAGQSSVYIWFYSKTGSQYMSDVAIDDVIVTGEQ